MSWFGRRRTERGGSARLEQEPADGEVGGAVPGAAAGGADGALDGSGAAVADDHIVDQDDHDDHDDLDDHDDALVDGFVDDLDEEDRAREDAMLLAEIEAAEAERQRASRAPQRPQGPWDVDDLPVDDQTPRLDLGALRVPLLAGAEVRLDLDQEQQITSATLVLATPEGTGSVQLSAFAAPRSEGIWVEVLEEIEQSLKGGTGTVERLEGPHGPELRATLPTQGPDGALAMTTVRFTGVDGPRWLLRAVYSGQAAVEPGGLLTDAVHGTVVVRGPDPMAVRDTLPLRMPEEALAAQASGADGHPDDEDDDADAPGDPLALPERGPEITETR